MCRPPASSSSGERPADYYLTKPFSPLELVSTLDGWLVEAR
jgi:hypothetical protein